MPFWPKHALSTMEFKVKNPKLNATLKRGLEMDIKYLKSMMKDRAASYTTRDISAKKNEIEDKSKA